MSAVTSCPGEVELRKLVEGTLSGPEQASVTAHVESCPDCQTALERVSGGGGCDTAPRGAGVAAILQAMLAARRRR